MPENHQTFHGKRVLLTGHTGFKGSWLTMMLHALGAEVHGYALTPPTTPSLFEEANAGELLKSHHLADIRDHTAIARVMRDVQPEFVFHLAAQPIVLQSFRDPRETYEVNVMGTINLLEAVRQSPSVRVCQIITSDKCYENREWVHPYREIDPMGGADPYSSSKGCAELVASAYRHSFFPIDAIARHGVSLSTVRAGNVIGGGDWAADRIIPDCVRALEKGAPIVVRNPASVRPWQHVLEPLSGYLQLAAAQWREPARFAEGWNFGPSLESQVTVQQVVEQVIREWGTGSWTTPPSALTPRESFTLKLDISKAANILGWQPSMDFAETIRTTIEWYSQRTHQRGSFSARKLCFRQIEPFVGRKRM